MIRTASAAQWRPNIAGMYEIEPRGRFSPSSSLASPSSLTGSSGEKTTRTPVSIPSLRRLLRTIRARRQPLVSFMSATRTSSGRNLFAAPIDETTGTPSKWHAAINASFGGRSSIASMTHEKPPFAIISWQSAGCRRLGMAVISVSGEMSFSLSARTSTFRPSPAVMSCM